MVPGNCRVVVYLAVLPWLLSFPVVFRDWEILLFMEVPLCHLYEVRFVLIPHMFIIERHYLYSQRLFLKSFFGRVMVRKQEFVEYFTI